MAEKYQLDEFRGEPEKRPDEQELDRLAKLVDDFSSQVQDIQEGLDDVDANVWEADVDVIKMQLEPVQLEDFHRLIQTDNKLLSKILTTFAVLSWECKELRRIAETKFVPPLALYAEDPVYDEDERDQNGEVQLQLGRSFLFFQEFSAYLTRCFSVVKSMLQQLSSLYLGQIKSFADVNLTTVFSSLAELLGCLLEFDVIIERNGEFSHAVARFRRMVKLVHEDPGRFDTSAEQLRQFDKLLMSLEGDLFDGMILENCCQQQFDIPEVLPVRKNRALKDQFEKNVGMIFEQLDQRVGEANERDGRRELVGACALMMLQNELFGEVEKSVFRQAFAFHKRVPLVSLYGNYVWLPGEFLIKKMPNMQRVIQSKDIKKDLVGGRRDYLLSMNQSLEREVRLLYVEMCIWMSRFDAVFGADSKLASTAQNLGTLGDEINEKLFLIVQGISLAHRMSQRFSTAIALHDELKQPISKALLLSLLHIVEMTQNVRSTFHREAGQLGLLCPHMSIATSSRIQRLLIPFRIRLDEANSQSRQLNVSRLDQIAAAALCVRLLNAAPTKRTRLALQLSMHVALKKPKEHFKESEILEIAKQSTVLDLVCSLNECLERACDCSALYWHRELLSVHIKDIFVHPTQAQRLRYLCETVNQWEPMLKNIHHLPNANALWEAVRDELLEIIEDEVIEPLQKRLENDLRLNIHTVVLGRTANSIDVEQSHVRDLTRFLQLKPLRVFDKRVDIRGEVSAYLNKQFYNLTTIALSDWKTYGEMRSLAERKYGLELLDSHLPQQTLEQGLDVLEITRNIHIFVAKYAYNLNTQVFIERPTGTEKKHLNTMNIRHISNSIRTHGTGMMNTTVNFVYQFLMKKFMVFSQFLFDDHIKSMLIIDRNFWKKQRDEGVQQYPYKRAQMFLTNIRKLGQINNQTYLDMFRDLLIEIGNAMAYVRLVRSGGLQYISDAIKYIPDLKNIKNLETAAKNDKLSTETEDAARSVDCTVLNLSSKIAGGSDYFRLLVEAFSDEMRNEKNRHFENFYIIVAPLTLSYIDYMMKAKEKLGKKAGKDAMFTDDGFALGLAFILKLLDQFSTFDSLHWFESAMEHLSAHRHEMTMQLSNVNSGKNKDRRSRKSAAPVQVNALDEDDIEAVSLRLQRSELEEKEFDLLYWSFSGARVFFRFDEGRMGEEEHEEAPQETQNPPAESADAAANATSAPPPPPASSAPPPPPAGPPAGGAPPPPPPPPPPPM